MLILFLWAFEFCRDKHSLLIIAFPIAETMATAQPVLPAISSFEDIVKECDPTATEVQEMDDIIHMFVHEGYNAIETYKILRSEEPKSTNFMQDMKIFAAIGVSRGTFNRKDEWNC